jgi:hypothetical protein
MNTTSGNLEMAIAYLQRAVETGRFSQYPQKLLEELALLKRAAVKVRGEIAAEGRR